ncbi:MAG: M20/M25/M40 family metallo-hydrolase, partial [Gammaproteobacteria bacterium]
LAYLRTPDPNLAARYMDATDRYLKVYEPLLGEYPYSKFALVENFWETGYGMPSFTLLGPQVIRFPFILETSYPHEILHNWWGNSVYPDYASGNWSEGLTAYLADHLFREIDGLGHEYRKEMLARYKNYVTAGRDFPLSEFTSRNSAASQAVGYGKTLMVWHMLRIELGDDLFIEGLRRLYSDYKFQRASWLDIADLFSDLAGTDLLPFFQQWVNRTGSPELSLNVEETAGNRARLMFTQLQLDEPYSLRVPVALYYADSDQPEILEVNLGQRLEAFIAEDYDQLQAVVVDPYFDVFRTLDREETPPTVGELFGAEEITFVVPGLDQSQWMDLVRSFGEGVDYEIVLADGIDQLPTDRSVWLLGRNNPFLSQLADSVSSYGAAVNDNGVVLGGAELPYQDRSTVVIGRHPADPELALGWIHIEDMVALSGMIEKLPHYGKYSYLSFYGDEPTNDTSGVWESPDSPLRWVKPELVASLVLSDLPARESIAELPPEYETAGLMRHVSALTAASMQGRGLGSQGLDAAAFYLADAFRDAGLETVGGTYLHRWRDSLAGYGLTDLANVIGMIPGSNPALGDRPVVVGAHYDHLGLEDTGRPYPGADDNASGVAVLLELASKLARSFTPQRPILFVAFTGEEQGLLGSQRFVEQPPGGYDTQGIFAMINLDAVGRLEGRAIQVFGSDSAYEWPFMAQGIGFTIGVDSEMIGETIAASDHVSFLNAGVPAIHLFSGTHGDYHRPSDTADKLD